MSCVLRAENEKGKNELRHAINPAIVKRSMLIGHLPPEVALCGLAALHRSGKEKRKSASLNPKCITWETKQRKNVNTLTSQN